MPPGSRSLAGSEPAYTGSVGVYAAPFAASVGTMGLIGSVGTLDYAAGAGLAALLFAVLAGAVWRLMDERSRRGRRERERVQALEQELDGLLVSLRPALALPDNIDLNGAEGSRPPAAGAATRIIDARLPAENAPFEQSFDRYRDLLRRTALLDALIELRRADRDFAEAARRLDRRITGLISDYNAPRRIDPLQDRLEMAYFFGRMHQIPEVELLVRIGMPHPLVAAVQARAAAIASDGEVATLTRQYLAARELLATAVARLGSLLGRR